NVYGGTQDNATQGGPSRTNNDHGIRNSDWFVTVFGDGFEPAVDPTDPDTIYSQWQYGGLVRYNRKTGEAVDIKPQEAKEGPALRWNWDSPLLISPHNSKRLYYASQILFRSDDRGDNWVPISPDLTRQIDRNGLKVMGRVWGVDSVAKNASTSLYGNIVALDESIHAPGLIYVGTDEGLIQITEDGGATWRKVDRFGTLEIPEFGYIHDIEADLFDSNTVYVVVNNHKRGDFKPYIVKSTDRGKSWHEITGDLPERGSVYTLKQDHVNPKLLFCGTEFGCFFTVDGGSKWIALKSGLPTIMVRDIESQRRENDLVL
ncbi:MAG: WD40/YVTN/BNR-like repeat-containing protein, partial [Pirellula sp.]